VLYLSTQGEEFTGGGFAFVDPHGRLEVTPKRGLALTFSSGWENVHGVSPLISGQRYALPAFFETRDPALETATSATSSEPLDDALIAQEMMRTCLRPQVEEDVRDLMRGWHSLLA